MSLSHRITEILENVHYNSMIKVSEKAFKTTANFSRPADTNAYTTLDAITNSTSEPLPMTFDLSSYISGGEFLYITNARISGSTKLSGANMNLWLFPATFSATNDNSELSIDDTTMQSDGIVIPCPNLYTTAANSRLASDAGGWMMKTNTSSIYGILQAASAFTAGNSDRYDVIIEGLICK